MPDLVIPRTRPTVLSVFGRQGAVVAASGDYNAGQITFTPSGFVSDTDTQAALATIISTISALNTALADFKGSVRVATTANITLSGTQTIDGVSVIAGDRVLVKDQSTGSQNGIYVCAAGSWSRATDADGSSEVTAGMVVVSTEGTVNSDKLWELTTNDPITLGTTALTFEAFSGSSGDYTDDDVLALVDDGYGINWVVTTDSLGTHLSPDRIVTLSEDAYASEIEIDLAASVGELHRFTLTGNPTLSVVNFEHNDPGEPGKQFTLNPVQDGTGGRTIDFTGSAQTWIFPDGEPALTSIPGGEDFLVFRVEDVSPATFRFMRAVHRPRRHDDTVSPFTDGSNEWQYANVGDALYDLATFDVVGNASVSAGTFTITVDGETTSAIAFNATGWEIYQALLALASIVPGDLAFDNAAEATQRLSTGATISFKFIGADGYNSHTTSVNSGGLTGGTYSLTDNAPSGSFPSISGTYRLSFGGQNTGTISVTANAATIQAAMESLSTIGSGNISVTGGPLETKGVLFEFIGTLAHTDVGLISFHTAPTGASTTQATTLRAGVADVGNEAELNWLHELNYVLLTGSGTHTINLGNVQPSQTIRVAVENDGGSGTVTFDGVDFGDEGSPTLPGDGTFDLFELTAIDVTKVVGKTIQTGCTP